MQVNFINLNLTLVCHSAHAKSSHYEVLGVHKTASDDDIKKAYLKVSN